MKKVFKTTIIILPVCLLGIAVFFVPRRLPIKSIVCKSQYGACNKPLEEELQNLLGKNLVEIRKTTATLLESKDYIEKYSIRLMLPNSLRVDLLERKANYAVGSQELGFLLVDGLGTILQKVDTTSLPYLNLNTSIVNSDGKVEERTLFALDLLSYVYNLYNLSTGNLYQDRVEFLLPSGPKTIFPLEGDKEVLIGSLRLIIGGLNSYIENHRIEKAQNQITIDLRFKNPVIR